MNHTQDHDIEKLHDELAGLQLELELKNQHIAHMEATLNEVLPLRRHFKRQIKNKLRLINQKISHKLKPHRTYEPVILDVSRPSLEVLINSDRANFTKYKNYSKISLGSKIYTKSRDRIFRTMSKLLRIAKV